jgi:LysR family transcriptional regulator for metE and metH
MDLELRHLRLVRAVVSTGSLTRAGDTLHVSQSALSHQLHDIEDRLGVSLFARIGRRLVLTAAGERLLQSAHEILDVVDRTEATLRELAGRRGPLRVSVEGYTCYHWLPAVLERFRRKHPRVDVRIDPDATGNPVRTLLDGRIDVGLIVSRRPDPRLVQRSLFDDAMVVAVAKHHPLARRRSLGREEIADELLAGSGMFIPTEALVELVKAGLHLAVVSRWMIEPYVKQGAIRFVPLAESAPRCWSAAVLAEMSELDYVRDFVDALAATTGLANSCASPASRHSNFV